MEIPQIIADLALILITAGITTIIFKWLKQPVILGYILAGFLVSRQFGFTRRSLRRRPSARGLISVLCF